MAFRSLLKIFLVFLCGFHAGEVFARSPENLVSAPKGNSASAAAHKLEAPCFKGNSIIINEDNDHFFKGRPEDMTEKGLRDYIAKFYCGKITHMFMCPNGQRTSYKSEAHEAIWECAPDAPHRSIWCDNCKRLYDSGIWLGVNQSALSDRIRRSIMPIRRLRLFEAGTVTIHLGS